MEFGGRVKTVLRWRREAFVLADCLQRCRSGLRLTDRLQFGYPGPAILASGQRLDPLDRSELIMSRPGLLRGKSSKCSRN